MGTKCCGLCSQLFLQFKIKIEVFAISSRYLYFVNLKCQEPKKNIYTLTIIFENIIDNAIEAYCKCKPNHRSIKMTCRYCDGIIMIYCENSTCDNIVYENGTIASSKHDKTNHGYDISNIKRTVEEYDGTTDIECKKWIFSIEVNIKEKSQRL